METSLREETTIKMKEKLSLDPAVCSAHHMAIRDTQLTEYGHSLKPIINEISSWGIKHRDRVIKEMSAK